MYICLGDEIWIQTTVKLYETCVHQLLNRNNFHIISNFWRIDLKMRASSNIFYNYFSKQNSVESFTFNNSQFSDHL